jgi:hypothetical protein
MWQLLSWKKQIGVTTAVVIIFAWGIDAAVEWFQGERASLLKFTSLIAMLITVVVAGAASLTWRHIWRRFPFVARKTFPDLTGTWEGTLHSTWIDPATGQPKLPIPTTIWIRQGLFSTSIRLRTGESFSYSTRCTLEADHDAGRFRVWYSYDNQPNAEVVYRSARHEGVAWLEMDIDAGPDRLAGQYYSSRRTSGDMEFRRTSRELRSEVPQPAQGAG